MLALQDSVLHVLIFDINLEHIGTFSAYLSELVERCRPLQNRMTRSLSYVGKQHSNQTQTYKPYEQFCVQAPDQTFQEHSTKLILLLQDFDFQSLDLSHIGPICLLGYDL